LKLEAERRLGQLMAAQKEDIGFNAGTAGRGRPILGGVSDTPPKTDGRPTLAEAGIDKNLAKKARLAAALSEEEFEEVKEAKQEAVRAPLKRSRNKKKVQGAGTPLENPEKVSGAANSAKPTQAAALGKSAPEPPAPAQPTKARAGNDDDPTDNRTEAHGRNGEARSYLQNRRCVGR
jgi:hypothetical protein